VVSGGGWWSRKRRCDGARRPGPWPTGDDWARLGTWARARRRQVTGNFLRIFALETSLSVHEQFLMTYTRRIYFKTSKLNNLIGII